MKPICQTLKQVNAESKALDRAVPLGGAVDRAVYEAVDDAVRDAVDDAVYVAAALADNDAVELAAFNAVYEVIY